MSRKAVQIFEKMKRTKTGWRPHHFHTLYSGFGFKMIEGKKHTTYIHPKYTHLRDEVSRHDAEMSKAYARDAVKNIEALLKLQAEEEEEDNE